MYYEIVELEPYSGNQSKVYSIIPKGETETLFEKFVGEYEGTFKDEVTDILKRVYQVGHTTGARDSFFKSHEGKHGDFVCALFDIPEKNLRVYCMRFGMIAVILGGGAHKPKSVKSWQQDEKLSEAANEMIDYAKDITSRLDKGDLYWSQDKTELEGNLKNYDNEEDN